jgi:hypothetical protein
VFALVVVACALLFPDRREELEPALWEETLPRGVAAAE